MIIALFYTLYIDYRLRGRVNVVYRKKFATIEEAEVHYGLTLSHSLAELVINYKNSRKSKPTKDSERSSQTTLPTPLPPPRIPPPLSILSTQPPRIPPLPPRIPPPPRIPAPLTQSLLSTPPPRIPPPPSILSTQPPRISHPPLTRIPPPPPRILPPPSTNNAQSLPTEESVFKLATLLESDDLETLLNELFLHLALEHNITSNPGKYCSLSIKAMKLLKKNNKSNLLYKFALALCNTKPVTGEPVFPMDRMPFGLVEYQIEFFSCTHVKQVQNVVIKLFNVNIRMCGLIQSSHFPKISCNFYLQILPDVHEKIFAIPFSILTCKYLIPPKVILLMYIYIVCVLYGASMGNCKILAPGANLC